MIKFEKYLAITTVLFVVACGSGVKPDVNPVPDQKEGPGLFSGKTGNMLDWRSNSDSKKSSNFEIQSKSLYESMLNIFNKYPLAIADSSSKIISTEWFLNPKNSDERYKVQGKVLGDDLKAENLDIKVFKEQKVKSQWETVKVDATFAANIKTEILNNAKAIINTTKK